MKEKSSADSLVEHYDPRHQMYQKYTQNKKPRYCENLYRKLSKKAPLRSPIFPPAAKLQRFTKRVRGKYGVFGTA